MTTEKYSKTSALKGTKEIDEEGQIAIMFGSKVQAFFDEIHEKMDSILREEISSLPFLPDDEDETIKDSIMGEKRLLKIVSSVYIKQMKIAEAYTKRNIFSLPRNCSRTQKNNLIKEFLKRRGGDQFNEKLTGKFNLDSSFENEESEAQATTASKGLSSLLMPQSVKDLPTDEKIIDLNLKSKEIQDMLRVELSRRNKLKAQLARVSKMAQDVKLTKEEIDSYLEDGELSQEQKDGNLQYPQEILKICDSISSGTEQLGTLITRTTNQMKRLDEVKAAREVILGRKDGEDTLELDKAIKIVARKTKEKETKTTKKRSLEEQYEEQRNIIAVNADRIHTFTRKKVAKLD